MFHVICLETGEPHKGADGLPVVFAIGQDASDAALSLTVTYDRKYQPRRIKVDDSWKAREQARFDSGEYIKLPWADACWWHGSIGEVEHFAHVSTERDGMIAFTEDAIKGGADRQTRVRPGTYLTRFYAGLSARTIQELTREFAGKYEQHNLCFAKTPDEIERVYTQGPDSCMSRPASDYNSRVHPVRVYGAGDLAVAYLVDATDPDRITARALCWPEKKIFGRVYGDKDRLGAALQQAGFCAGSWGGAFLGARLLRIENEDQLVCPYIDGCPGVEDDGEFLRIGGDLESDSTSGLISMINGQWCPRCEENTDEEFAYIEDREESWCHYCISNHAMRAANNGRYYADEDNVVWMASGVYWSVEYFEHNGGTCEATGANYPADELVYVQDIGDTWHRDYHRAHGFQCTDCSEHFSNASRGARQECCESCSGEADRPRDLRGRYRPRQGRDEHPAQMELDNTTPF